MTFDVPTVDDVYRNHELAASFAEVTHEGTHVWNPDGAIRAVLDGAAARDDPYRAAAHILRGLTTRHVFEDGNHRTAYLTAFELLIVNDLPHKPIDAEEDPRVMKQVRRYSEEELARWLETGEIELHRE